MLLSAYHSRISGLLNSTHLKRKEKSEIFLVTKTSMKIDPACPFLASAPTHNSLLTQHS